MRAPKARVVTVVAVVAAVAAVAGAVAVAVAPLLVAGADAHAEVAKPFLLGGTPVTSDDPDGFAAAVAAARMNAIEVTAYARQGDWDSADVVAKTDSAVVARQIRAARRHGLRVVLVLRVELATTEHNRHLWHGMIAPAPYPSGDMRAWFKRYGAFVAQYAELAAAEHVDVLAIGSELATLSATTKLVELPELYRWHLRDNPDQSDEAKARRAWAEKLTGPALDDDARIRNENARRAAQAEQWAFLIADVRRRFHGRVTYAANHDEWRDVAFWPAVDDVGINAYFKLRAPAATASSSSLAAAWASSLAPLADLHKPVIFTELGFTRCQGATIEPWSTACVVVDREERARALEALRAARPAFVVGALWWKLSAAARDEAIEPFALVLGAGDPAEAALRDVGR